MYTYIDIYIYIQIDTHKIIANVCKRNKTRKHVILLVGNSTEKSGLKTRVPKHQNILR